MEIRPARAADLSSVERLLREAKLPWEDVAPHLATFLVGVRAGEVVACAGFEPHGTAALLRSFVIQDSLRSRGLGAALCDTVIGDSRRRGARDAYLLTNTAERFFTRRGFAPIPREAAPPEIRATREFSSLCPASAVLMHREL
jgi:amino-acid N-acetyltransferase